MYRLPALHGAPSLLAPCRARRTSTACGSLVRDIQLAVSTRQRSAEDVTREWLALAHSREARLDSFLRINDEGALAQARTLRSVAACAAA